MSVSPPVWTNEMLTTVTAQHADWWTRSEADIARRIALIEIDGNLLHAFAPKGRPKKAVLVLAYKDRRKESREILQNDRRRTSINPPPAYSEKRKCAKSSSD